MESEGMMIHAVSDAPWLPSGGRAEVIKSSKAPLPTSMVRLLVRRGRSLYCVPRERSGMLDLPTRAVPPSDPDGSATALHLAGEVFGTVPGLVVIGFVRNIVQHRDVGYQWPTPFAHFSVWQAEGTPIGDGTWVGVGDDSPLLARHWFPLIAEHYREPSRST